MVQLNRTGEKGATAAKGWGYLPGRRIPSAGEESGVRAGGAQPQEGNIPAIRHQFAGRIPRRRPTRLRVAAPQGIWRTPDFPMIWHMADAARSGD
jgi:hypothetical protein